MRTHSLNCFHDILALRNFAENDMFAVKPTSDDSGDEELTTIGVRTSVGHREAESFMLELKVFVFKAVSVDGLSTGSISPGEVTSLNHKVRDDSVEAAASISKLVLTFTEFDEVIDGSRHNSSEHINDDVSCWASSDFDGEGDFVSHSFLNIS